LIAEEIIAFVTPHYCDVLGCLDFLFAIRDRGSVGASIQSRQFVIVKKQTSNVIRPGTISKLPVADYDILDLIFVH
jgi:hypothetical protein